MNKDLQEALDAFDEKRDKASWPDLLQLAKEVHCARRKGESPDQRLRIDEMLRYISPLIIERCFVIMKELEGNVQRKPN